LRKCGEVREVLSQLSNNFQIHLANLELAFSCSVSSLSLDAKRDDEKLNLPKNT
jgi:hypothetical protein